jgi:hypothetical protein
MPEMIVYDGGLYFKPSRKAVASADMTTAADITDAPAAGQKVLADDILISADTAMRFDVVMETTGNVLASVFLPVNGTAQITLRAGLKGDAAGKKLQGKTSAAGNVRVSTAWHSEA